MRRLNLPLLWVARTPNKKTDDIPTAYVGMTLEDTRASCFGCLLLDTKECYAWAGFTRLAHSRHCERVLEIPEHYTLARAMEAKWDQARAARIAALGDPAHVKVRDMRKALATLRENGLAPIVYTHHWRERIARHLRTEALASCNTMEEAELAIDAGWTPSVVLPWDHFMSSGPRFYPTNASAPGVVCPAQTKPSVTCNDCRLCSKDHPVWKRGTVSAIGFLDHSRKANREKKRALQGKQLPMFAGALDTRKRT